MARIRKISDKEKLAVGASIQLGKQLLPAGVSGNDDERVFGLDFQFSTGRRPSRRSLDWKYPFHAC